MVFGDDEARKYLGATLLGQLSAPKQATLCPRFRQNHTGTCFREVPSTWCVPWWERVRMPGTFRGITHFEKSVSYRICTRFKLAARGEVIGCLGASKYTTTSSSTLWLMRDGQEKAKLSIAQQILGSARRKPKRAGHTKHLHTLEHGPRTIRAAASHTLYTHITKA